MDLKNLWLLLDPYRTKILGSITKKPNRSNLYNVFKCNANFSIDVPVYHSITHLFH